MEKVTLIKKNFSNSDYKHFLTQYKYNKISELSDQLKYKYKTSNLSDIMLDKRNGVLYEYLEFSKPFYSNDSQTAYIEVNNYSAGIYGDGTAYILKKNKTGWKIVRRINLWIS